MYTQYRHAPQTWSHECSHCNMGESCVLTGVLRVRKNKHSTGRHNTARWWPDNSTTSRAQNNTFGSSIPAIKRGKIDQTSCPRPRHVSILKFTIGASNAQAWVGQRTHRRMLGRGWRNLALWTLKQGLRREQRIRLLRSRSLLLGMYWHWRRNWVVCPLLYTHFNVNREWL
jgi:hypothetical protein